ncbi:MAG: hypothetical protein V3T86_09360 [Planctomycetota bacterium]
MIRTTVSTLAAILVLAATAAAQQAPFDHSTVGMLSAKRYEQPKRQEFHRAIGGPLGQAARLQKQIGRWEGPLRKAKGKKAQQLRKQIQVARNKRTQIFKNAEEALIAAGLAADDLARLKRMPRGDLREERWAHRLVLEASNLSQRQREILIAVVASTDAVQRVLLSQERGTRSVLRDADVTLRKQIQGNLNRGRNEVENRFWRVVYYTLTPDQMREVREHFSTRYAYYNNVQGHIYQLPGLTASQGARVRALFTEQQAESTADRAARERIRRQMKDKSLDKKTRQELQKEQQACQGRLYKINAALIDRLKNTLTEEQLAALRARPARLGPQDLNRHPQDMIKDMNLRPGQRTGLEALGRELQKRSRAIRTEMNKKVQAMGADYGPESPQAMTMQMMRNNAQGEVIEEQRELAHRAVMEILDTTQITEWVATPKIARVTDRK